MSRTARDKRPYVKPVKKIELSNKNVKRRIIFVALFLVLGVLLISQAIAKYMKVPAGWTEIKVEGSSGMDCGKDFAFYYKLGESELSTSTENRNLKNLYASTCVLAYQLFENVEEIKDCNNVYYINKHPNEEINVSEDLYNAFEKISKAQNRDIYLGPVIEHYSNIFFCENDVQAREYDPYTNSEIADYYQEIVKFSNDEKAIDIMLLGDNKIKLQVSEEYLAYAKENAIENFIDFGWMKNAFIADFIANTFIKNGYEYGMISSYDGFSRCFVAEDEISQFGIDCEYSNVIYPAATMDYTGSLSMATMRNYDIIGRDKYSYYIAEDGTVRNPYIDIKDGKCKSAIQQLTTMSKSKTCSDLAMSMADLYIAEEFDEDKALSLKSNDIFTLYCKDKVIYYNSNDISLSSLYEKDNVKFEASFVEK